MISASRFITQSQIKQAQISFHNHALKQFCRAFRSNCVYFISCGATSFDVVSALVKHVEASKLMRCEKPSDETKFALSVVPLFDQRLEGFPHAQLVAFDNLFKLLLIATIQ